MQTADKTPIYLAFFASFGLQISIAQAQVPVAPTTSGATAIIATTEDHTALRKAAQAAMQAKDWSQALGLWDGYLLEGVLFQGEMEKGRLGGVEGG